MTNGVGWADFTTGMAWVHVLSPILIAFFGSFMSVLLQNIKKRQAADSEEVKEVKEKLKENTSNLGLKLEEMSLVAETTKTYVNHERLIKLKKIAELNRELASLDPNDDREKRAVDAEKEVIEHMKAQASVDALQKNK